MEVDLVAAAGPASEPAAAAEPPLAEPEPMEPHAPEALPESTPPPAMPPPKVPLIEASSTPQPTPALVPNSFPQMVPRPSDALRRTPSPKRRAGHALHSASAAGLPCVSGSSAGVGAGPDVAARAMGWSNPKPEYPAEARSLNQEGVVMVGVVVSAAGDPSEVSVHRSSGHALLDDAAVRAVRRWRFEPARTAGLPVTSHVEVPVRFNLRYHR